MPAAHAQRLRLRLFVEGIEIPVISANIQAAPNSPAVASIQIPPLAEATRFLPRSIVHLFFLDMFIVQSPFLTETRGDNTKPNEENPTTYEQQRERVAFLDEDDEGTQDAERTFGVDRNNVRYKLLFGGEIVGFALTKSDARLSIVLQCEDFSNYWDYAYQWSNTGIFGPGIKAVFSGGATNLFTDFLSSESEKLASLLLHGKSSTFPNLTGLAAGIIKLIESIGGTYFPPPGSGAKRIAGQNIFFSLAELRLKITHMVAAIQDDDTSRALLNRAAGGGMFGRALGGLGSQTSVRQAINALTKIIFHEIYPQPCPMFVPGSEGDVQGLKTIKLAIHPKWSPIVDEAAKASRGASEILTLLSKIATDSEGLTSSNVSSLVAESVKKLAGIEKQLKGQLMLLRKAPKPVEQIFTTAITSTAKARVQVAKFRPGAPPDTLRAIYAALEDIINTLEPVLDLTVRERATKDSHPSRIVQQVFRPDIWFAAPPRCNVLFPESYSQMSYQRMFLQEPTRFLLKTNDEFFGEDFLFDKLYFAPQAGGTAAREHTRLQDILQNSLLDHELFTGILPIHEKMGEFNIFAGQTRSRVKTGKLKGVLAGAGAGAIADALAKIGPAQRSANFLYFKHRFNSRRMQIRGKFNPYIAIGCPGLIIDRHVDSDTIARYNELKDKVSGSTFTGRYSGQEVDIGVGGMGKQDLSELLGTNFLGNFTAVTHSVSNQEPKGLTEVVCSYPRQSEESVEFLGSIPDEQKLKKKTEDSAVRSTIVAALNPPRIFSLGPNLGRITSVHDASSVLFADQGGLELPLFDSASPASSRNNPIILPVSRPITARELDGEKGTKVAELAGGLDVPITLHPFYVTEEISRYRRQEILIPAEEFIRPGWYGNVWTSANIGKVYTELFGTGSITDEQTITGPSGATTSSQSEDNLSAMEEAFEAQDASDPRLDAPALLALEKGASIQDAVEFLHLTYSYIRQSEMDTEEFIRAYTWRPIATMVDMFGTSDLEFTSDGSKVVTGIEGFHSKAFGPYENLHGLADPEIENIIGIGRKDVNNRKVDTRLRKYKAVQKYVSAIRFSRAILG